MPLALGAAAAVVAAASVVALVVDGRPEHEDRHSRAKSERASHRRDAEQPWSRHRLQMLGRLLQPVPLLHMLRVRSLQTLRSNQTAERMPPLQLLSPLQQTLQMQQSPLRWRHTLSHLLAAVSAGTGRQPWSQQASERAPCPRGHALQAHRALPRARRARHSLRVHASVGEWSAFVAMCWHLIRPSAENAVHGVLALRWHIAILCHWTTCRLCRTRMGQAEAKDRDLLLRS